jgi:antitoxin ChpS
MATVAQHRLSTVEEDAVCEFRSRLSQRYGERFRGLVAFGSRARRDHRPDSDLDVAVILAGTINDVIAEALAMADDAYDVLLDHGLHIQPLPIEEGSLEHPDAHPVPHLTRHIAVEGIRL